MKTLTAIILCLTIAGCTTTGRPDWRKIGTTAVAVGVTALIVSTSHFGDNNHRQREQPCPNVPKTCH